MRQDQVASVSLDEALKVRTGSGHSTGRAIGRCRLLSHDLVRHGMTSKRVQIRWLEGGSTWAAPIYVEKEPGALLKVTYRDPLPVGGVGWIEPRYLHSDATTAASVIERQEREAKAQIAMEAQQKRHEAKVARLLDETFGVPSGATSGTRWHSVTINLELCGSPEEAGRVAEALVRAGEKVSASIVLARRWPKEFGPTAAEPPR